jgi:hypothetical protein
MTNPSPPHHAHPTYPAPKPTAAVYPLSRPAGGGDPRFTVGLALDVAAVLTRHGYPTPAGGADLAHWQQILFTGIYTHHRQESTP